MKKFYNIIKNKDYNLINKSLLYQYQNFLFINKIIIIIVIKKLFIDMTNLKNRIW